MHDHNLDDLIIDTVAPKNNKAKSFLTIVALFIVIIIVMIILNKTFINPDKSNALILDEELTTTIAPELKLQEQGTAVVPKPEEATVAEPVVEVIEEPSLPSIIEDKVSAPIEPTPTQEPKILESVEVPSTDLAPTQEPVQTKPEVVEQAPAPVVAPVTEVVPPKPTVVPQGTYFVQVGSYRNKPSPSLLKRIKNNGFNYRLTKANNNGIKKLLIGPYTTRTEVDKALAIVRSRLVKQAFVVKK